MNDTTRNVLIIVLAFVLILTFMPWGGMMSYGNGWGVCGMAQRAGYGAGWMTGIGGWFVNIALIVIVALVIVWLLRVAEQSDAMSRRKKR
ncbi:MAG: hypothetical protein AABX53_01095 [Nanoarchaeota archaeon]